MKYKKLSLEQSLNFNEFSYSGVVKKGDKEYITYTRNNGKGRDDIIQEVSMEKVKKRLLKILTKEMNERMKNAGFDISKWIK